LVFTGVSAVFVCITHLLTAGAWDNEDNIADIIREGGVQRVMDGELIVQASRDCVQITLKRLEEKITGRVLNHLLYLLRASDGMV
jgi:hypothetical protein